MLINLCLNVIGKDKFGVELHKRRTPKVLQILSLSEVYLSMKKPHQAIDKKVYVICPVVDVNLLGLFSLRMIEHSWYDTKIYYNYECLTVFTIR